MPLDRDDREELSIAGDVAARLGVVVEAGPCATRYTREPDPWRHIPLEEQPMDPDNAFQIRGVCLTCHTRSFRLNADGACLKCYTHAADLRAASMFPLPFEAASRQGWDIGVCIRCGFIKTCHDSICRECREQR